MTGRIIDFYKETGRTRPQVNLDNLIAAICAVDFLKKRLSVADIVGVLV